MKENSITDIKDHAVKKHNGNGLAATLMDHIKINRIDSDILLLKLNKKLKN